MLFGLANDLIWPAVLMVVAISLGMASALSVLGIAAICGRNWAERRLVRNETSRRSFEVTSRLIGSVSVLVIGVTLFALTLTQHRSVGPMLPLVAASDTQEARATN